jgi:surfeit locus 1 family protein
MTPEPRAEAASHRPATRNRSWRSLFLPALLAFAALIALGTWQIERKAWKEALIASLTERLAAPPQALPPAKDWARLDRADDEYRRVKFTANLDNTREALVFAAASAFRPDVTSPGYWVFTPARLADGSIVIVNRGFVPDARRDAKSRPQGQITETIEIARDPAGIAAAKGLDEGLDPKTSAVAPFYVEQEAPTPPGGLPQPGKLVVALPDNHLQYAVTWYGLAAVLVAVFGFWAATSGRRTGPADRP